MPDDTYDVTPLPEPVKTKAGENAAPSLPESVTAAAKAAQEEAETAEDIEQNRPMAVLAYMGPFVVVPLIFARESRFARFHANQGLLLFLLEFGLWMVNWVLGFLFMPNLSRTASGFFNAIAHLYGFAAGIIWAVFAIMALAGILHAIAGAEDKLPVIGNFRIVKV